MTYSTNPAEVPVAYLKGVGPKRSEVLAQVGIETVEDLLYYLPRRYLDRSHMVSIAQIQIGTTVTVVGKVVMQGLLRARKKFYEIIIQDETGHLPLLWFNGIRYVEKRYKRGMTLSASGSVSEFRGGARIIHPEVEVVFEDEEEAKIHTGRIVPIYPSSEFLRKNFMDSRGFRRIIKPALDQFGDNMQDLVPESVVNEAGLLLLPLAMKQIHYPENFDIRERARHSLAFRELFLFHLLVADRRARIAKKQKQHTIMKPDDEYRDWVKSLPFKLTGAQNRVITEILEDLFKPEPMLRLLQGDVGSGKTAVATAAMTLVAKSGYQAAMMAPTDLLAKQHFETISGLLKGTGITPALLTGATPAADRRLILRGLATGFVKVIVGTHALISDDVEYQHLAFAVVDEQHRFGVAQREALLEKGKAPDLLVMTATPIPRTLALTAYGDLDVSIIDEMPVGRMPVKTALRTEPDRHKIYAFIRDEVKKGNQAFIIYPLVEESLKVQLKAATKSYEDLKQDIFPDLEIGLIHGQMKKDERDRTMTRFANHEIGVLVSTTVVEVGIDIPDATVILVEHAERFGLSQLHQLRGRVGRSDKKSYCILMTDMEPASESYQRLERFVQSNDGFKIAELDLELRGPGELLGVRQSGMPEFRVANIATDLSLILTTREYAHKLMSNALAMSDQERLKLNTYIKQWRQKESSGGVS